MTVVSKSPESFHLGRYGEVKPAFGGPSMDSTRTMEHALSMDSDGCSKSFVKPQGDTEFASSGTLMMRWTGFFPRT